MALILRSDLISCVVSFVLAMVVLGLAGGDCKPGFAGYGFNDSYLDATDMEFDSKGQANATGDLEIHYQGPSEHRVYFSDYEWYYFNVRIDGIITCYTTSSENYFNSVGKLFKKTEKAPGSIIAADDDSGEGNNFKIITPAKAGGYYLCIEPKDNRIPEGMGGYTLHVKIEGVAPDFWYRDSDADGYGDISTSVQSKKQPVGYVENGLDCDDTKSHINPQSNEICDGIDNNCNYEVDEGFETHTYYRDKDGDGFGTNSDLVTTCNEEFHGYVRVGGDCDDDNQGIYPGAGELCDDIDNDCDGEIDENARMATYYYDGDKDGYGVSVNTIERCGDPGPGWGRVGGDCNDGDKAINPGMDEICDNGIDENCSGDDKRCGETEFCLDIPDTPLQTKMKTAPPIVMIIYDNSSSMDYDILYYSSNDGDGIFSYGGEKRSAYYEGMSTSGNHADKASDVSVYWKTRCHLYNKLYYNPAISYAPWPLYKDADPYHCKKHPVFNYGSHDMGSDLYGTISGVDVGISHYFAEHEGTVYLVNLFKGTIDYYKVLDYGQVHYYEIDRLTRILPGDVPVEIRVVDYDLALRNMANWYQYHRSRELASKYATAAVLQEFRGAMVGIEPVNRGLSGSAGLSGVQPVKLNGQDKTDELIAYLYHLKTGKTTPLKEAFVKVGRYIDDTDHDTGGIGTSPYWTTENGGACQQAFCILVTDGYYTEPGINVITVGNADLDDSGSEWDGGAYADAFSNTLADIAMHYYEHDLSDTLDDNVSVSLHDKASHQHLVTYSVAFGVNGHYSPSEYQCPERCPQWQDPEKSQKGKVDDLWHAAVNGRGQLLNVNNGNELIGAFRHVFNDIDQRSRSGAAVSLNSSRLEGQIFLYQSVFHSEDWTGDLRAYKVSTNGGVDKNHTWSALEKLKPGSKTEAREILTFDGESSIPFEHNRLSSIQQKTVSKDLVRYIRGDSSDELKNGGRFRDRHGKYLGDIVNSTPVFVPDRRGDSSSGLVYVGANDGMLHAFDMASGDERFAYVPYHVFSTLHHLADPNYSHRFYVNNTVTVSSIYVEGQERVLLAGGLGKGGRGIYGIDITNQKQISESSLPFIFEYPLPDGTDEDMGFTYGKVSIVKSNYNGSYVILSGNGYDSGRGKACLYVWSIKGKLLRKIDTGVNSSSSGTISCNGLSSPVTIDTNNDLKVDYAYAGDLEGNLWKFDLTGDTPDAWNVAFIDQRGKHPLFTARNENGKSQPITCRPALVNHRGRERTGCIVIFGTGKYIENTDSFDPTVQTLYGLWDWSDDWEKAEGYSAADKHFGTVLRSGGKGGNGVLSNLEDFSPLPDGSYLGLLRQYFKNDIIENVAEGSTFNTRFYRNISSESIEWFSVRDWTGAESGNDYKRGLHLGWYIDLPDPGERITSRIQVVDGYAVVVSMTPTDTPCKGGGSSVLYIVDAYYGGTPEERRMDTNGDGKVDDDDSQCGGAVYGDTILMEPVITKDSLIFDRETQLGVPEGIFGIFYLKIPELHSL